jgi:hypothetical protein
VMKKIMLSLGEESLKNLEKIARQMDITVQELIRAVIIPDYIIRKNTRPAT